MMTEPGAGALGGLLEWHHTSTVVEDVDLAVAFHREAFGMQVVFVERGMREQIRSMLGVPDGIWCDLAQARVPGTAHVQEFVAYHDVPAGLDPRLPVRVGQGHVAYVVADIAAALDRVVLAGGAALGEVTDFDEGPAVYCLSPAGHVIELEQRR